MPVLLFFYLVARSLALRFTAANPRCVRAIPCEVTQQKSPLTMYLYVHTDGKGISKDFRESAVEMFDDYQIEFVDLQRRPFCKVVTQLSPSEKRREKKLRELAKTIEKNLHIFENRLNVTAVQASYKIEDSIMKDIPCVTVYVLGKGKIPTGESDILEMTKLDGYPFDVVEGYFQHCSDPKLYTCEPPLHSGVGIGVESDGKSVGTLGAFLKAEDGKRYILSCQHVLCPNENSVNANQGIVQPAELDYRNEVAKISLRVEDYRRRLRIKEERLELAIDDERVRCEEQVKRIKRDLEILQLNLEKVEGSKPRNIGKYCCGLKRNESVEFIGEPSVEFYVDAAIAELNKGEADELIDDKKEQREEEYCPVFGFEKDDKRLSPTKNIVSAEQFSGYDLDKLRFAKRGRTTGNTYNGELDREGFFVNLSGHQESVRPGCLLSVPFKLFCHDCMTLTNENKVDLSCFKTEKNCSECKKEIIEEKEIKILWAKNCLAIRAKKAFCEEGDSGALVFDDEGRAWGMVFGVFSTGGATSDFGLASPLSVTLKALEEKLGKKLELW